MFLFVFYILVLFWIIEKLWCDTINYLDKELKKGITTLVWESYVPEFTGKFLSYFSIIP